MKKFISMVMAAAMVVSLVPATAFAANTATFKVTGDYEVSEDVAAKGDAIEGTEIQMKVSDIQNSALATGDSWKITLDFENAEVGVTIEKDDPIVNDDVKVEDAYVPFATVKDNNNSEDVAVLSAWATYDIAAEDDSVAITLVEEEGELEADDTIVLNLDVLGLYMSKVADVTVTVGGKFGDSEEMTLVSVLEEGIKATLKKVGTVGEEATKNLKSDLVVETVVGDFFFVADDVETPENEAKGQLVELTLSKGFEWAAYEDSTGIAGLKYVDVEDDGRTLIYEVTDTVSEFVFDKDDFAIEAVDAKAGDVAKITVKVKANGIRNAFKATATVEAMKVVDETITLSVEEDEDLPVIYSGVNVDNYGINDDSDHMSLEITIEESVEGSLDVKKDIVLSLTEGVFVTGAQVGTCENVEINGVADVAGDDEVVDFADVLAVAYEEGDMKAFEIDRKTFTATDDIEKDGEVDPADNAMELNFKLELIAVPGFEGDVELTLSSAALEDDLTVTIATFKAPYTVEAAQNDLIIDYRNTEVPTAIVVKEAEAGLWAKDEMTFDFFVDYMDFEGDPEVTVNEESEMEVDVDGMFFVVDEESEDEAAVVTIDGIELYMGRDLAAGAYDLELGTAAGYGMMTGFNGYEDGDEVYDADVAALLTTTTKTETATILGYFAADFADWDYITSGDNAGWVSEYSVVKEGFVNIVTAGRDADDASFTTKVVVPVGAMEIIAGEATVALDVPAYINANGYTMLPVRAVAVALGIHNQNVLWDQATKTVTILYGQRIITMQVGSKVVNVNGSAIPASAAVEIVNGRTFLGLRDLATALGVVDITWDAATQTATLNGNK